MKNLIEKIDSLYEQFKVDANKNVVGNKAAGTRARKSSLEITKLMKEYRAKSVETDKA
jgi:hypothetical protein